MRNEKTEQQDDEEIIKYLVNQREPKFRAEILEKEIKEVTEHLDNLVKLTHEHKEVLRVIKDLQNKLTRIIVRRQHELNTIREILKDNKADNQESDKHELNEGGFNNS